MITYDVAKDFSPHPGGRYASDGKWSGEALRAELRKLWESKEDSLVFVNLDGGYGYGASFLEEVFGGLARELGDKDLLRYMVFVSNEEPKLVEEIKEYMKAALFRNEDYPEDDYEGSYKVWDFMSKWCSKLWHEGDMQWGAKVNWTDVSAFYEDLYAVFGGDEFYFVAMCNTNDIEFILEEWIYDLGYDLERIMG